MDTALGRGITSMILSNFIFFDATLLQNASHIQSYSYNIWRRDWPGEEDITKRSKPIGLSIASFVGRSRAEGLNSSATGRTIILPEKNPVQMNMIKINILISNI